MMGVEVICREQSDGRGSDVYNQFPEWEVEDCISCSVLESYVLLWLSER